MTILTETPGSKSITIADVAEALGVSKTTVSRAISGKGRIGNETRERVMKYIEEHDYQPNMIARSLAQSKTYNLALSMPGNSKFLDSSFFQQCMLGICKAAAAADYDVVVSMVENDPLSQLERMVKNHKVDGVILSCTWEDDVQAKFLKEQNFPFVTIGYSKDREIIQVDHNHKEACQELTSILLMKGLRRIALLGSNKRVVITGRRFAGYKRAFEKQGLTVDMELVNLDVEDPGLAENAVQDMLQKKVECIICMDDIICYQVLNVLKKMNVSIPTDVRVASFYNSSVLDNHAPAITSLKFDAAHVGMVACQTLVNYIEGQEVHHRTLLDYEVVLKESTK
jgi:DNA-binding LacI/PurR family transcriptional regulator